MTTVQLYSCGISDTQPLPSKHWKTTRGNNILVLKFQMDQVSIQMNNFIFDILIIVYFSDLEPNPLHNVL